MQHTMLIESAIQAPYGATLFSAEPDQDDDMFPVPHASYSGLQSKGIRNVFGSMPRSARGLGAGHGEILLMVPGDFHIEDEDDYALDPTGLLSGPSAAPTVRDVIT